MHSLTVFALFRSTEEDKEKTAAQVMEALKIIEDQALGDKKFFGGNRIGLVDLSFGWLAHWFGAMQETVGVQALEPNNLPRLHRWTKHFKQEPVIKENLPDTKALLAHFKRQREIHIDQGKLVRALQTEVVVYLLCYVYG
ncbi:UNVERIFIED_CONTAM: putative glutathione S-transferase [Sesamum indicum]